MTPFSGFQETSYIYIPNSGVSAIIGTRGSQIKHMMKMSGTRIIIPPVEKKVAASTSKRKVTIVGPPHCHYRVISFANMSTFLQENLKFMTCAKNYAFKLCKFPFSFFFTWKLTNVFFKKKYVFFFKEKM